MSGEETSKSSNLLAVQKTNRSKRKLSATSKIVAIFLFLATVVAVANYDWFNAAAAERILPGISIGPIEVGGKNVTEAGTALQQFLTSYQLIFNLPQGNEQITPFDENNRNLVQFNIQDAVDSALKLGHRGNLGLVLAQRLGAATMGISIPIPYSLNEEALATALKTRLGAAADPAIDARFTITVKKDGTVITEVSPEKEGLVIDVTKLSPETRDRLHRLSSEPIKVNLFIDKPKITTSNLEPLINHVNEIVKRAPRVVTIKGMTWTISRSQLANWIEPQRQHDNFGDWTIGLDHDRIIKHLETYASAVVISPKDAMFEMDEEGKKITKFIPGVNGEKIDTEASTKLLEDVFLSASTAEEKTIKLPVVIAEPKITTASSNTYGIKEVVGQASTNFKGSPQNRRHNITNGANALNGVLIPPGTEFSLVGALGKIDAEHGYLEELVIKRDKTEPEFGGGLCQIGTTTFRAVMDAGLPITQRQNHSYRVSYYERDGDGNRIGPGKDATIYDPWPDFKFINDTPGHILMLTAVNGDRLTFTFWGTKDGRTAKQGDVTIWNIKDPPLKKEIYTTDIPVGTTKCTESPHASASTVFTYSVTYATGETKEQKFYSYYKPWQEVCLIGATTEEVAAHQTTPAPANQPNDSPAEG